MPAPKKIELTEEQRVELEKYRDHDSRPYVRERCAAILKVAGGESARSVALNGLLKPHKPDTIYSWIEIYKFEGVQGLIKKQHGGYRRGYL